MSIKVVVTGAGGFIGNYAVKALYEAGCSVVAFHKQLLKRNTGSPWDIKEVDLLEDNTEKLLATVNPLTIVHCAAVLPVQFYGEETAQVAKINSAIDARMIKYCSGRNCRFIYLSSSSIYGTENESIITEESKVSPIGLYSAAKLESERMILNRLADKAIILRVSAPYGYGQRSRTIFRLFIERALANLDLVYHGTGKRQQDFTSAYDIANAIVRSVFKTNIKGIFNISGGRPISMRNLAEIIVDTIPGTQSKVIPSGQPDPQENYRVAFDIGKAGRLLEWRPKVSLEEGIGLWIKQLRAQK